MELLTDEQLITAYRNGDDPALEVLVARYLPLVYGFILRAIGNASQAEDLTQEIFLKVWRGINKYDSDKSFKTWIFTIARRTLIDYFRKKKIATVSVVAGEDGNEDIFESVASGELSALEKLEKLELEKELEEQLLKLPPEDRVLLLLYYGEKITFAEIAAMNKEPLDTVKSRHRRALIKLRKLMLNGQ
ncbi:sigma-70 family RNA polymerase sigma factor [Candidatus Falkowbacteria bacterium]|nr:sigma-70 family RNA polymerase sigma factor [Candidatus Falkowbacteria bacterium]